jgi:acyl-CoA hydrolase
MFTMKTTKDSETIMTEIVFPNDTNPMGILQGGRLMHWMDIASAVCAQRHAERIAVTAAIDKVYFRHPVYLGDILTIKAKITRAFNTSMEIYVEVWARKVKSAEIFLTNHAYFTFVALDDQAMPVAIPPIIPSGAEEKAQYTAALKRKESRK